MINPVGGGATGGRGGWAVGAGRCTRSDWASGTCCSSRGSCTRTGCFCRKGESCTRGERGHDCARAQACLEEQKLPLWLWTQVQKLLPSQKASGWQARRACRGSGPTAVASTRNLSVSNCYHPDQFDRAYPGSQLFITQLQLRASTPRLTAVCHCHECRGCGYPPRERSRCSSI